MSDAITLESALAELRGLFPRRGIFIDADVWDNVECEQGGEVSGSHAWVTITSNEQGVKDADFSAATLATIMENIRGKRADIAL